MPNNDSPRLVITTTESLQTPPQSATTDSLLTPGVPQTPAGPPSALSPLATETQWPQGNPRVPFNEVRHQGSTSYMDGLELSKQEADLKDGRLDADGNEKPPVAGR